MVQGHRDLAGMDFCNPGTFQGDSFSQRILGNREQVIPATSSDKECPLAVVAGHFKKIPLIAELANELQTRFVQWMTKEEPSHHSYLANAHDPQWILFPGIVRYSVPADALSDESGSKSRFARENPPTAAGHTSLPKILPLAATPC